MLRWRSKPLKGRVRLTDEQEYFAEVDEDYILDRFNLTGLNGEVVQEYSRALDLITDSLGQSFAASLACQPTNAVA